MRALLTHWLVASGLPILLIVVLALVLTRALTLALRRFENFVRDGDLATREERLKRARTLSRLVGNVSKVMIFVVASLMVLQKLDLDIRPILAGAGILGLAVGFGAQTLVKDVIGGFFLILENHIRVGDVVEINGTGGLVEAIHLRTIVLRDVRGAVHVFPCGSVGTLANLTKDFAYAVLDVKVHYRHDIDKVIDLLRTTAGTVQKDDAFKDGVLQPLEVLGVEQLGDTGVTIRSRMKTVPHRQWEVARELRRRVKDAFGEAGIQIPVDLPLRQA